ncbi:MAG TPA: 6,7-dimethyl-8-ribityllumazine synthase [Ignavibacteriaceae bacterium]
MNIIEGNPSQKNYNIAIVVSKFNEFITERLLEGAKNCFINQGYDESKLDVVKVPGAFEIPITASRLASSKKYTAIVCLGAVIRGATPHFEYVSQSVANGILRVSLDCGIPVIFGVLTTNNIEQAMERSGGKSGNKGWDAAMTAIEMTDLLNNKLK